ncbi:MAG: UDP-N-acetylmuramoyl-L-alanine--D-glutamate ligase, partial [Pseudomonadota bacterium]
MPNPYGLNPQRPVVVYGLGASGRVAALALAGMGIPVWACDDSAETLPPELAANPLIAHKTPVEADWPNIQLLLKAPGIAMNKPLVQAALAQNIAVLGETDLLWQREQNSGAVWLGITGTNGKSTTTALVGHVLRTAGKRVAVGGNIGTPALALPSLEAGGFYVLELSSYQLEMLHNMAADGAVFLNLTPDHLERHGDMETYRDVKLKLLTTAKPDATRVLGTDQPIMREAAAQIAGAKTLGTLGQPANFSAHDSAIWQGKKRVLELADFPNLPGPHNAQNIMAALALLVPRWLSLEQFKAGVQSFKGLPHRLEKVAVLQGVTFINDSKATNGDSAVFALQSYPHIYWICGGRPKTDGLGACVNHLGAVRAAFTMGEAGQDFAQILKAKGVAAFESHTMNRAVADAFNAARTEGLSDAV